VPCEGIEPPRKVVRAEWVRENKPSLQSNRPKRREVFFLFFLSSLRKERERESVCWEKRY